MFSISSHKNKHSSYKFKGSVRKSYSNRRQDKYNNLKIFLFALGLAVLFRTFFFDNFHVPSGSMKPTLLIGDKIIVSKMSYGYSRYSIPFGIIPFKGRVFEKSPKRGDIIVFKLPKDKRTNYVKRLIGLPGDKIQVKDGVLYINGKAVVMIKITNFIDNDYKTSTSNSVNQYIENLPNGASYKIIDYYDGFFYDNTDEFIVPQDHYFFMGDNRDNSQDSRTTSLGFVHKDLLIGKVKRILISSSYSLFNPLHYNKIHINRIFLNPYISEGIDEDQTQLTIQNAINNKDLTSKTTIANDTFEEQQPATKENEDQIGNLLTNSLD